MWRNLTGGNQGQWLLCLVVLSVAVQALSATPAAAQAPASTAGNDPSLIIDVQNLEQGIPLRVQDGEVLPEDRVHLLSGTGWNNNSCADWWQGQLELAAGLPRKRELIVGYTYLHSSLSELRDGDTYLTLLRQFQDDPDEAYSLYGVRFDFPTGRDYARLDRQYPPYVFPVNQRARRVNVSLMSVFTKVLNRADQERVHLQLQQTFVNDAPSGFYDNRWLISAGYDRPLNADTIGLAGIWWEESPSIFAGSSAVFQLGIRRRESRRLVWSTAVNMGLNWEDASWGITLAGQYQLRP